MLVTYKKPYRLVISASRYIAVRERVRPAPHTVIARQDYAYMGWTATQSYQEARLPSAGSFLYPGIHAVRRAAMAVLALPSTRSVSVRTNQDHRIYLFNK